MLLDRRGGAHHVAPLSSALDSRVGALVWERAVGKRSLCERDRRTRIVVTHDPRFVDTADRVVVNMSLSSNRVWAVYLPLCLCTHRCFMMAAL